MAVKLGDLLLKSKLITTDQLEKALKLQREEGGKIGEALVRVGAVSEGDITETLSQQFGVPSIDLAHFEIDPAIIKVVPGEVARKYGVLPVNKTGATLTWKLTFSHLSGKALAAHIHSGKPGVAGAVLVPLCGPCKGGQTGKTHITKSVVDVLESGRAYVNVHTPKNQAGEIRGQIATKG